MTASRVASELDDRIRVRQRGAEMELRRDLEPGAPFGSDDDVGIGGLGDRRPFPNALDPRRLRALGIDQVDRARL